jgi:hypothetical protein
MFPRIEARQAKQNIFERDLGLQRILHHAMRRVPGLRRHDDDVARRTES